MLKFCIIFRICYIFKLNIRILIRINIFFRNLLQIRKLIGLVQFLEIKNKIFKFKKIDIVQYKEYVFRCQICFKVEQVVCVGSEFLVIGIVYVEVG